MRQVIEERRDTFTHQIRRQQKNLLVTASRLKVDSTDLSDLDPLLLVTRLNSFLDYDTLVLVRKASFKNLNRIYFNEHKVESIVTKILANSSDEGMISQSAWIYCNLQSTSNAISNDQTRYRLLSLMMQRWQLDSTVQNILWAIRNSQINKPQSLIAQAQHITHLKGLILGQNRTLIKCLSVEIVGLMFKQNLPQALSFPFLKIFIEILRNSQEQPLIKQALKALRFLTSVQPKIQSISEILGKDVIAAAVCCVKLDVHCDQIVLQLQKLIGTLSYLSPKSNSLLLKQGVLKVLSHSLQYRKNPQLISNAVWVLSNLGAYSIVDVNVIIRDPIWHQCLQLISQSQDHKVRNELGFLLVNCSFNSTKMDLLEIIEDGLIESLLCLLSGSITEQLKNEIKQCLINLKIQSEQHQQIGVIVREKMRQEPKIDVEYDEEIVKLLDDLIEDNVNQVI